MSTNTPAASAERAPRRFDNFQERLNGRKPASAATSPGTPAPIVATGTAELAQAVSPDQEMPEWARAEMRAHFAARASGQGKTAVTPVAKEASQRTSAERWERANAKIEKERRTYA